MAKLFLIMLAAPLALAGVPAAAQFGSEPRSVTVHYNDLNLASAEGRERLNTRVKSAVKTVCGSRADHRQALSARIAADRCETTALADADVKLASLLNGDGTRYADRGRIVVVAAP